MTSLERYRRQLGLTQREFAAHLTVPGETYRTWESGRRSVPSAVMARARRLADTECGQLLPLQLLAQEAGIHVRTLRQAARDGRLVARVSARMAFGKAMAFASRDAVARFQRLYYRQTTTWNRPTPPTLVSVPGDYDQVLRALRIHVRLSQAALAQRIGAANKAVIYQWESRRRRPSPVLWQRIVTLAAAAR
jgi:DNA-binding transcriptional regulator YiaG